MGGGWFNNQPTPTECSGSSGYKFATSKDAICKPITGYQVDAFGLLVADANGNAIPIHGPDTLVSGFRLQDARASYGVGLETFALGFPIHFDWSWRTLFNKEWEDVVFAANGGSSTFRKPRFAVWIGYDF